MIAKVLLQLSAVKRHKGKNFKACKPLNIPYDDQKKDSKFA